MNIITADPPPFVRVASTTSHTANLKTNLAFKADKRASKRRDLDLLVAFWPSKNKFRARAKCRARTTMPHLAAQ